MLAPYLVPHGCQMGAKIKKPIGVLIPAVGGNPNKDTLVSDMYPLGLQKGYFGTCGLTLDWAGSLFGARWMPCTWIFVSVDGRTCAMRTQELGHYF